MNPQLSFQLSSTGVLLGTREAESIHECFIMQLIAFFCMYLSIRHDLGSRSFLWHKRRRKSLPCCNGLDDSPDCTDFRSISLIKQRVVPLSPLCVRPVRQGGCAGDNNIKSMF